MILTFSIRWQRDDAGGENLILLKSEFMLSPN